MRYLKIALSGTALFLVYLWVSVLLNSCNNNKTVANDSTENVELLADEIDYTEDEFEGENEGQDFTESNDEEVADEVIEDEYEESSDYIAGDYTSSKPEKTKLEPKKKTRTFEAPTTKSQGNSYGEYMVIAGSYLLEDNAQKMVRKLKGMGYSKAEIVYFDQSQYHSICAGKYESRSMAKGTSTDLKNQGIDSYVHRKQD
jgi:cell division protein FtsN